MPFKLIELANEPMCRRYTKARTLPSAIQRGASRHAGGGARGRGGSNRKHEGARGCATLYTVAARPGITPVARAIRYIRLYTYPTGTLQPPSPHPMTTLLPPPGLPHKSAAARRSETARPEVTRLLPSTHVSSPGPAVVQALYGSVSLSPSTSLLRFFAYDCIRSVDV